MKSAIILFKIIIFSLIFFYSGSLLAEKSAADIKTELILEMKKDGYLNDTAADEAARKYITEADKQFIVSPNKSNTSTISWREYLSWINFFKVTGVIFFLVAFSGIIKKIIAGLWGLIVKVPIIFYQLLFLSGTITGTIRPGLFWESQSFYIALFSSFANIMLLSWIISSHEDFRKFLQKLFKLGIPPECIASFWGMIYFAGLAFAYKSQIFGFFAAVSLSGMLSFTVYYLPGTLFLYFKEEMLNAVIFGHLLVLSIYIALFKQTPELTEYFNIGMQYYCTIALGVGLIVGASPFYKIEKAPLYAGLFILLFFLASFGYFFFDLKVMASITFVFFILFILEWIGFFGYQTGLIIGSAIIGGSLFALGLLLEKYGSMIILYVQ